MAELDRKKTGTIGWGITSIGWYEGVPTPKRRLSARAGGHKGVVTGDLDNELAVLLLLFLLHAQLPSSHGQTNLFSPPLSFFSSSALLPLRFVFLFL